MKKLLLLAALLLPCSVYCSAEQVFADSMPPNIVCWHGLSVNLRNTGVAIVHASDFVRSVSDNSTPSDSIVLAIRRCGTGASFPIDAMGNPIQSLVFQCNEMGNQCVEIWAMDSSGVRAFVTTYAIIQDNLGTCKPSNHQNKEDDIPPTIVVKNGLSAGFNEEGLLNISVEEFVRLAKDDTTSADQLTFSIRLCGTGIGFPTNAGGQPVGTLTLNCFQTGTRCVEIWARDEAGNADNTETYILAQDNMGFCPGSSVPDKSPTAICQNGIVVNLSPSGTVALQTKDMLQSVYDDNTPSDSIEISMRRTGTGFGFPLEFGLPVTQLQFNQNELGINGVEIWARDKTGRENSCETYVKIENNTNESFLANIIPCVNYWCNNAPLHKIDLQVQGNAAWVGNYSKQLTGSAHCSPVQGALRLFGNATATPKAGPNAPPPHKGVTVFDLALVKRFILGYDDGLSPFAVLAADANRSGTVTGADILEMRQVILGQNANFPDDVSWRYIEGSYQFPNPQNPFQEPLPENVSFYVGSAPSYQVHFKAVKVGDLDCDGAYFGEDSESKDRGLPKHAMSLPNLMLGEGQQAEISFQLDEPGHWSAMQWELRYDPEQVEINEFMTELPGLQQHEGDMSALSTPGSLRFLWASAEGLALPHGKDLFSVQVRAKQSLQISEALSFGADMEGLGLRNGEQTSLSLAYRSPDRPRGEGAIFPPLPNPTTGTARIPMRASQPNEAQIELTDATGRRTWAHRQSLDTGEHWIHIPAEAMPQAGVYFWRASLGAVSAQGKLLRN